MTKQEPLGEIWTDYPYLDDPNYLTAPISPKRESQWKQTVRKIKKKFVG